jgi:hypothetical protein
MYKYSGYFFKKNISDVYMSHFSKSSLSALGWNLHFIKQPRNYSETVGSTESKDLVIFYIPKK